MLELLSAFNRAEGKGQRAQEREGGRGKRKGNRKKG
jgi:hypothetical protein